MIAATLHMGEMVGGVMSLLLVAAGIYALTKRTRFPFTVALVLVGIGLSSVAGYFPSAFPFLHGLEISPGLILYVFLPTLIFESAFNLDYRQLRQNLGPVLLLAVPGLLLSTAIIGFLLAWLTSIPLQAALLLGAILSATDPVAVVSLFKKLGAPRRLTMLVEGESLFNDATSLVLAAILLDGLMGRFTGSPVAAGVLKFLTVFAGGLLVGWLLGLLFGWLVGQVNNDPFVEITLTTVLAYLSFLLAEELLQVSGVMATVAAGLTLGGWGRVKISAPIRDYMENFWEYMAFVANALIFLMVGLSVHLADLIDVGQLLMWVILAMLVSRFAVVFGLMPLVRRFPGSKPISRAYQTVMCWGGLRGAVALAIVLSLPPFGEKDTFVALVMGAVLFTLLAQGLTIETVVRELGLDQPPLTDRLARMESALSARHHALERLPHLLAGGLFSGPIGRQLHERCEQELITLKRRFDELRRKELSPEEDHRWMMLRVLAEERSLFLELLNQGQLSEPAFRHLQHKNTLQVEALRQGDPISDVPSIRARRQLQERAMDAFERVPFLSRWVDKRRQNWIALDYELAWGRYQGCRKILKLLHRLESIETIPGETLKPIQTLFKETETQTRAELDEIAGLFPEFVTGLQETLGRRLLVFAEVKEVENQVEHGLLPRPMAESMEEEFHSELRGLRTRESVRIQSRPQEMLRTVPFFRDMPETEFAAVAEKMRPHSRAAGETIIRQGDAGRSLFLIARGVVRVSRREGSREQDLATLIAGEFFGEMALMREETRNATVRAVTACSIYELRRDDLDGLTKSYPAVRRVLEEAVLRREAEVARLGVDPSELLLKVPCLQIISPKEFKAIAGKLREHSLAAHQTVFLQGDPGESLFLIARGVVEVWREEDQVIQRLATLVAGDFFGETALLSKGPRNATVRAVTACTLYEVHRADLEAITRAHPNVAQALSEASARRSGAPTEKA